jgi:hypothetical protein
MPLLASLAVFVGLVFVPHVQTPGASATQLQFAESSHPTPATPLKTTATMVASHLDLLAGMPVWLEQARIERILSPRAFILVATWGRGDRDVHDSRVLVLTTDPAIRIREDMLVEVFGRPFTLQGARAQDEWAGAGISGAMEEDYAEWPVLIATGGQAPGGVMMFGRPPR